MLKSRFGPQTDRIIQRMLPFLARLRVRPDTRTLLGVAFSAASAVAFAFGQPLLAAFPLGFAGICDLIDGAVARAQGATSMAGAFLDSSMDRLSDVLVFGGIAFGLAAAGDLGGVALVLWTLGGLGWLSLLGWAQNSLPQTLPPLVLVIGVCDGIHLVSRLGSRTAIGGEASRDEHRARVLAAAGEVARPCVMTTLTTIGGLLPLALAGGPLWEGMSWLMIFGLAIATVLTLIVVPCLYAIFVETFKMSPLPVERKSKVTPATAS